MTTATGIAAKSGAAEERGFPSIYRVLPLVKTCRAQLKVASAALKARRMLFKALISEQTEEGIRI